MLWARNCVYLCKIENSSYYQELDELTNLVWIKLQHPFPDNHLPSRPPVDPGFITLAFKSVAIFFIIDESTISKTTISFFNLSP